MAPLRNFYCPLKEFSETQILCARTPHVQSVFQLKFRSTLKRKVFTRVIVELLLSIFHAECLSETITPGNLSHIILPTNAKTYWFYDKITDLPNVSGLSAVY